MKEPLVSIVIPTYNRAGIIRETIEDVFRQTYQNIELIVVDDGSTDDTQSILRSYDNKLRRITQPNAGPAAARNRGAEIAKGTIIAFQDSDDSWHPTKIARQVALLQRVDDSVPCCLSSAQLRFTDRPTITSFQSACLNPGDEEGLWLNALEVLTDRFVFFNQTAAIRRSALEKVGGFNEQIRFLEDYDLPLRLALLGPFGFIREPLVTWNQGSDGSWSQAAYKNVVQLKALEIRIRENLLGKLGTADRQSLRKQMEAALARTRRELQIADLRRSDSWAPAALGYVLDRLKHYTEAAVRRSPWFIEMKTMPLPMNGNSCLLNT
jgi:glycosyltransferase involved in cell wall biosynthesis